MNITHIFATKLRILRQSKGISQEQLAELTGLHRTYICALEREKRNISLKNIARLAAALNVAPHIFFIDSPSNKGEE